MSAAEVVIASLSGAPVGLLLAELLRPAPPPDLARGARDPRVPGEPNPPRSKESST